MRCGTKGSMASGGLYLQTGEYRAARRLSVPSTTDDGVTDEFAMRLKAADDTAGIYLRPRMKASRSLFPGWTMLQKSLRPLLLRLHVWLHIANGSPLEEKKNADFELGRLFACVMGTPEVLTRTGAKLQLRSLLVLFPYDACPNIFLFKTSAAPSGRAWLLYCERPVGSHSGDCRVFFFFLFKVPNSEERNPAYSEFADASGRL